MAYSSDEREMRRLRRQRIIEEQERQQRLDDEIEYLQNQREQLISNRRYERQLQDVATYDEPISEAESHITIDKYVDPDESGYDHSLRSSGEIHSQTPKSILKKSARSDIATRDDESKLYGSFSKSERQGERSKESPIFRSDKPLSINSPKLYRGFNGFDHEFDAPKQDNVKFKAKTHPGTKPEFDQSLVDLKAGDVSSTQEQSEFIQLMNQEIHDLDRRLENLSLRRDLSGNGSRILHDANKDDRASKYSENEHGRKCTLDSGFKEKPQITERNQERAVNDNLAKREKLLKERERMIKEKERELRERELYVESQEKKNKELIDPYEEMLRKREQEIEQRLKDLKMKELDVYTRETSLKKKEEERQKNIKRIESELENKQSELDNLDTYMKLEADSLNINVETETMKATDPNLISEMDISKCHKSDIKSEPESMAQDKTFYFPKFSIFSGEDPKPKTEATFEEWKYEVSCLRKDKIYSDTVIGQAIRKSLKGQAKKVLLPMGSGASVDEILVRLEGVFGNVATPMSILQEFYTAYQKQDESVAAWGLRLEEILQRAQEKGQLRIEEKDELLRNKFWRSLKSERLKSATRLHFHTIKSFDLLRQKVRAEEYEMKINSAAQQHVIKTEKSEASSSSTESKMDLLLERMSDLEKKMKEMDKRKPGRWYRQQNQNQRSGQQQNFTETNGNKPKDTQKDLN